VQPRPRARMRSKSLLGRATLPPPVLRRRWRPMLPRVARCDGTGRRYTYDVPRRAAASAPRLASLTATRRGRRQFGALHMSPSPGCSAVRPSGPAGSCSHFFDGERQPARRWLLHTWVCRDPLRLSLTGRIRILFFALLTARTGTVWVLQLPAETGAKARALWCRHVVQSRTRPVWNTGVWHQQHIYVLALCSQQKI